MALTDCNLAKRKGLSAYAGKDCRDKGDRGRLMCTSCRSMHATEEMHNSDCRDVKRDSFRPVDNLLVSSISHQQAVAL